ncbi:MAG: addiction module protein [Gemmatimonadota bacterium]
MSLGEDVDDDPAAVEHAWEVEIRSRRAEVEAGSAELIPAEQVFSEP